MMIIGQLGRPDNLKKSFISIYPTSTFTCKHTTQITSSQ
jgi:hypothetical protein